MIKLLILVLIQSICYSCGQMIGNYSQYISDYNRCGLSKNTLETDTKCFEYHQYLNAGMHSARGTEIGEAPWAVLLESKSTWGWIITTNKGSCGGALINNQWVLTAAHCLITDEYNVYISHTKESPKDYNDYIKSYIKSYKKFKHPQFKDNDLELNNDIGLIKLDRTVGFENNSDHHQPSFICLPSKEFPKRRPALGLMCGWGALDKDQIVKHLQIGTRVVFTGWGNRERYFTHDKAHLEAHNTLCKGDSGSPIWMYEMGRAVVVGIHSSIYPTYKGSNCGDKGFATFVPKYIDWILETIQKN